MRDSALILPIIDLTITITTHDVIIIMVVASHLYFYMKIKQEIRNENLPGSLPRLL